MKEEVLKLLKESGNEFISGENLSKQFGISRAAIWKYIKVLKEDGYNIESVSRKGYRILSSPDVLTYEEIEASLKTKYIGRKIFHFDVIGSTNTKAKEIASLTMQKYNDLDNGTIVISEGQTAGKGRLGRVWESPTGKGIWFSIILKPDISPLKVSNITIIGASAVNLALKEMGVESYIKWPNDIIIENKKVCGILTEMSAELDLVNYIVMGIGINVNIEKDDFPKELKNKATSLKAVYGKEFNRKKLLASILNNFEELYDNYIKNDLLEPCIKICRDKSILIGKEVFIEQRNKKYKVRVLDINNDGALVIQKEDGNLEEVISGEVSMHGLYGYMEDK
ncbi:biotin--[acetyl-CoA-carboxylase] ligase [Hathewaya limosa]|uniref:Bifunctional ligase/repressor BirA n=1 Tax=Hathewaya limosa TaxID=1536 RepID=A0ABU0JXC5_HATLI|nr:BirA family biotin operon repressor/biotin-[acetyl-CoA-carboxylase] ligase [Hathewaya limosa]